MYIMIQTNKSITCLRFIYENTYIGCKTINMGNRVCSMAKRMECARSRNRTRGSPNDLKWGVLPLHYPGSGP